MGRPSSIDRMPEAIRLEIGRLRQNGATIDAIIAHLRTMHGIAPSRSALGRHVRGMDKVAEKIRRSREVAEALVRQLGDAPEGEAARLNIELLHSQVLEVLMRSADGEEIDANGAAALAGDPEGIMFFAKTLDHLSHASRNNIEFIGKAEARAAERAKKDAAKAVDAVGRAKGISAETIDAIKRGIFGMVV